MRPDHRSQTIYAAVFMLGLASSAAATEVSVCTDQGAMTFEMLEDEAPLHVANFLEYVDQGFYSGTVFHRVIDGFMIQGGGFNRRLSAKQTHAPVKNESNNGVSNARGTVAAARTSNPDSATSQFFINVVDNERLDGSDDAPGYTVFARVTQGMDVADAIAKLPTRGLGRFSEDVPDPLVQITSMARLDRHVLEAIPEASRTATLRERAVTAYEMQDYAKALEWLGHYRAACGTMDLDLLLIEAESSAAAMHTARARSALDQFFARTDEGNPDFDRALALYAKVAPGEKPDLAKRIGDCAPPSMPTVPNGREATMDEMLAGQTAVRTFMTDSEMYLDCLSLVIDKQASSDSEQKMAVEEHNRMVSVMESLAEDFNTQVRRFKARQ